MTIKTGGLRVEASCLALLLLAPALSACDSGTPPTFVQAGQVMQWITDHECDRSGAQKGYPAWGGEGMGQIAQVTFVCDNGKTFDIRLQNDGTYKYTKK